eukprot:Rmarinus@m.19897
MTKKLEASRDDFLLQYGVEAGQPLSTREVDTVLTTGEILELLEAKQISLCSLERSPPDPVLRSIVGDEMCDDSGDPKDLLHGIEGGSGGYLESIFRYAAKTLFDRHVHKIEYELGRNADYKETKLLAEDGTVLLHFAQAYGFRNIQSLIRKIKLKRCQIHFVEIMACPGGCLNGGGQIRPQENETAKNVLQSVDQSYHSVPVRVPSENTLVRHVYERCIGGSIFSKPATEVLHTQYHDRKKGGTNAGTLSW